jgi:hypothetical protein
VGVGCERDALLAETERLREALEIILAGSRLNDCQRWELGAIAERALRGDQ